MGDRAELRLRVTAELKDHIKAYAEQLGVPINTAAILLLQAGLRHQHQKAEHD